MSWRWIVLGAARFATSSSSTPSSSLVGSVAVAVAAAPSSARSQHDRQKQPVVLKETDLDEKFVKGGGKGGQKVNKTNSRVQLRHIPTGIVVETQRFRELPANRKEARKLLTLKLDDMINGPLSKTNVANAKEAKRKQVRRNKAKKKYQESAGTDAQAGDSDDNDNHGQADA